MNHNFEMCPKIRFILAKHGQSFKKLTDESSVHTITLRHRCMCSMEDFWSVKICLHGCRLPVIAVHWYSINITNLIH